MTPENIALLRAGGPRAADLQHRPRRAASSARAPGSTAPDIEFHFAPSMFVRRGPDRAARPRLLLRPVRGQADAAAGGSCCARRCPTPSRACCTTSSTTDEDRRSHDRRHPHGAGDRRAGAAEGGRARRRTRCPTSDSDEDILDFIRAQRADRLPPDLHLRDRLGRRRRAARAGRRGPARGRRLGDADASPAATPTRRRS